MKTSSQKGFTSAKPWAVIPAMKRISKEEILDELRRTAAENVGKPLGRERFERITGITE